MKFGVRKVNLKSSFKARTTGKLKRKAKRAVNPFYGKKGIGWIKNPKKAAHNAVYHRTTIGVGDIFKSLTKRSKKKTATKQVVSTPIASNNLLGSNEQFQVVDIKKKVNVQPQDAQLEATNKVPEAKPQPKDVSWGDFFIALGAIAALIGAVVCFIFALVAIFSWNDLVGNTPVALVITILLFAGVGILLLKLFLKAGNRLKK